MGLIERLDWDTDFFGYEIGKCQIHDREEFQAAPFEKEAMAYRLVYVLSEQALDHPSLRLVDRKVVFKRDISQIPPSQAADKPISAFDPERHEEAQLISLALQSGIYSRFYVDKNFKNREYEKLYRAWITNCVHRQMAFEVLVAPQGNRLLGFITLSHFSPDTADIGLLAVHPEARGQGLGQALIQQSIYKAQQADYQQLQVVTQLDNVPACRLYQKAGFHLDKLTHIYHHWNL